MSTPNFVFANNVQTILADAVSNSATTITLASSANFPTIPFGHVWAVTLNDQATGLIYEICYATSISGNVLTVMRGQEGTAAVAWNVGDYAYAADTAGILSSFANSSVLTGYVELSPSSQQTGYINVSGNITGAMGTFNNVSVGGALTNATTGMFSSSVEAATLFASEAYSNLGPSNSVLTFNGLGGIVGVGPSSGLTVNGITSSMLAIGSAATGDFIAIDTSGNISTNAALYAHDGIFLGTVDASVINQNGIQVVNTITSSTLTVNKTGYTVDIEISGSGAPGFGASLVNFGNGGPPSIALPNYGQWFIEVTYAFNQTSNSNLTLTLSLNTGTMTGGFVSNASGNTAFNAEGWISLYGNGSTTVNNQTLTFDLSISGGSIGAGHQPWTVRATRTA